MRKTIIPLAISALFLPQLTLAGFTGASTTPLNGIPVIIDSSELNSDDTPDLISINTYANSFDVILSNNDQTYQPAVSYPTDPYPLGLSIFDVDLDNDDDLVIFASDALTFSVFFNDSNGIFIEGTPQPIGFLASNSHPIDLNGDSYLDLVVTDYTGGIVTFINNTDGTFTESASYYSDTPTETYSLGVADFNGDNFDDIVIVNFDSECLVFFFNNGDGTFAPAANFPAGQLNDDFVIGDFDNDDDSDLLVGPYFSDDFQVLLNNGNGDFASSPSIDTDNIALTFDSFDFNNDGYLDIATNLMTENNLAVYLNNGLGGFLAPILYPINQDAFPLIIIDQFGTASSNGEVLFVLGSSNNNEMIMITADFAAPLLAEITPVPNNNTNTTPSYTFSSTEAGNITYGGACSSLTSNALAGNNTVSFNTLSLGTHDDCTILITDNAANPSQILPISPFTIINFQNPQPVNTFTGAGGDFGQNSCSGNSCESGYSPVDSNSSSPETPTQPAESTSRLFTDIQNHWAKSYIEDLQESCSLTGYLDIDGNSLQLFKPDSLISRAELITLIIRCQYGELNNQPTNYFPDLPISHWSNAYVKKAFELNIISGYPDQTFRPDQAANRAEALKIILLAHFQSSSMTSGTPSPLCQDLDSSAWYYRYFNFALEKNIISGYRDSAGNSTRECGPANFLTRAEAAKIIALANRS